jgi:hypothetical protein
MAKMFIKNNFQHKGTVYRTNEEGKTTLKVSPEDLKKEMALGKITKKIKGVKVEKWVSGLLNHCEPADREAKTIVLGMKFDEKGESEDDEKARLKKEQKAADDKEKAEIHEELEKLGKGVNPRLGLPKLRDALKAAKIEAGE